MTSTLEVLMTLGAVILTLAAVARLCRRPIRWVWRRNVSAPLGDWAEGIIERGAKRVVIDELLDPEDGVLVKLTARVVLLEEQAAHQTHVHIDNPTVNVELKEHG